MLNLSKWGYVVAIVVVPTGPLRLFRTRLTLTNI